MYGFFFFFQQKTAYEMRICDWSSDVCSSDLRWERPRRWVARREPCNEPWQREPAKDAPGGATDDSSDDAGWAVAVRRRLGPGTDRKRVVLGRSGSVRVELGGRRIINKTPLSPNSRRRCTPYKNKERYR